MNNKLFAFTSASGTGKTTLLNKINDYVDKFEAWKNFKTIELSGRPYLPEKGDYIENKSDSIGRRINYGSLVTFSSSLLNYPDKKLFFSRCAIDRLAYIRALDVGRDLESITITEIKEIVIPHIKVFYMPIEFALTGDDEVRGTNEKLRIETDNIITNIIKEFDIPVIICKGNVMQRMNCIIQHI